MTVSVEHLHDLYYRLTVQFSESEVEEKFEHELWRCGEIGESLDEVRQRIGDEAWARAAEAARQDAYRKAVEQCAIQVVTEPELTWVSNEPGADPTFTGIVEILPSIDLSQLAHMEIEEPVTEVTEADVERALELIRSEHKTFGPVVRAARLGDRVVFNFHGAINGEPFEGGSGQNVAAILGAGDVLDAVEQALTGRWPGEDFDADIPFPEDYADRSLRGRTARFRLEVRSVMEPEFPEITTDFVRRLGVESGAVDELRENLRYSLKEECDRMRRKYEVQQVTQALLDNIPVQVPETLLQHETERMRQTLQGGESQHGNHESSQEEALPDEAVKTTAERRVALSLILSEMIRQHDIRIKDERIEEKLNDLAVQFPVAEPETVKQQYRENPQLMHSVQALVTEEDGFDAVRQAVRRKPVAMSFDALLQVAEEGTGQSVS